MLVSVIIPHYNDLANLHTCLELLRKQTIPRDHFEIVIADNNSTAGLHRVRAIAGEIAHVVLAARQGAGLARNAGALAAHGDCLAFLDSDCRPAPDWLERGIAALQCYDIVGGAVRVVPQSPARLQPAEAFEMVFAFHNEHYIQTKGFSVTANLLMRRKVFDRVGPFRNGVSEDIEWCHRARSCGMSLGYAGNAIVEHPARRDWPALRRKWRRLTEEQYQLASEQRFGRLRWFVFSFAVLLSPIPHLLTIAHSRDLPTVRDRLAAAGVLFRVRAFRFLEHYRVMFAGCFVT